MLLLLFYDLCPSVTSQNDKSIYLRSGKNAKENPDQPLSLFLFYVNDLNLIVLVVSHNFWHEKSVITVQGYKFFFFFSLYNTIFYIIRRCGKINIVKYAPPAGLELWCAVVTTWWVPCAFLWIDFRRQFPYCEEREKKIISMSRKRT